MHLAPLTLSVCENGTPGGAQPGSCPFCGVRFAEGREPFLCADGFEESSCVPCFLVRHLERETIAEEAVLIWLPDLSQAALNALANGVHRRLAAEGAPHGTVVHADSAATLRTQPDVLERLLGVAR